MSNEPVHINELRGRFDQAVQTFCDIYVKKAALLPEEFPTTRKMSDWLDDFQAWLDIELLKLPAPPVPITPNEAREIPDKT